MVIKESCPKKLACKAQQLLPESSAHLQYPCCGNAEEEEDENSSVILEDEDRGRNGDLEFGDREHKTARGNWAGKLDFFLSCVGYAVGLGNIWRFPYLCYRNGGGAFLIPYFLFLILCGMPLFMLEISFGQFANLGPISIWKISPLFKGLGYGMVIISGIVCVYYNIIITWTLYYMFLCFRRTVPWATCGNWWNSELCLGAEEEDAMPVAKALTNSTLLDTDDEINVTEVITVAANVTNVTLGGAVEGGRITASEEFWINHVLELSPGLDEIGHVRWELLATLLVAWILVFCCLFKGVKSSGKVVYFSATFPYAVLVILLIYGASRPGASEGIKFYLTPRWELLKNFEVWGDAATQIFYSVGPAWGGLLTMASYNKFNHNCYRDAFIIPMINCGTSVFAGFVVFSVIGFMAHVTGRPISEVVSQGPGLAFVVYPEAVTHLPAPPVWAFLFFSMLFTIGLDSQVRQTHLDSKEKKKLGVHTQRLDPTKKKKKKRKKNTQVFPSVE